MKIQNLFERPISRPINGVVKADQLNNDSVWQELDGFVVTGARSTFPPVLFGLLRLQAKNPDVAGKIGFGSRASLVPENRTSSKCCRISTQRHPYP